MVNRKASALIVAALLLAVFPAQSRPVLTPLAIAQVPQSFPLPESVPSGTKVRISCGSDSTSQIAQALGSGFEAEYPDSDIAITPKETSASALQDVLSGNADLAAISRPLTAAETAKGLIEVPVLREKIAIAVGRDNPFTQSLTVNQFAQIFRGEIKDWSEVGGSAGPIRVIDRPDSSEIRQALQPYPVFATADFKTGDNATQLTEDSTAAVAAAVGNDGIGYAPIAQLDNQPTLRALELHQTPPTDSQYPFSQPYSFVYAGGAQLEIAAFLGYSIGEPGQALLSQVNLADSEEGSVAADPAADGTATAAAGTTIESASNPGGEGEESAVAVNPDSEADATSPLALEGLTDSGRWWWLLLPLVGLGLFIWAASSRSGEEETATAAATNPDDDTIRSPYNSDMPNPETGARADDAGFIPPASAGADTRTEPFDRQTSTAVTAVEERTAVPAVSRPPLSSSVSAREPALTETLRTENLETEQRDSSVALDSAAVRLSGSSTDRVTAAGEDSGLGAFTTPNADAQPDVVRLESGASWLDRAKTRINEATDQLKDTSAEDDLRKDA
ncbi:MAG: substrate-binding domain-containing protein [Phormidesmis sp.]